MGISLREVIPRVIPKWFWRSVHLFSVLVLGLLPSCEVASDVERPPVGSLDPSAVVAPVRTLGHVQGMDGSPAELFQVTGGFTTTSGSIVLANEGDRTLRVFDAAGNEFLKFGREGEGPGEFLSLAGVFPYLGDSILAFDRRQQRLSVWSQAGTFGRTISPPLASGPRVYQFHGPLSDGRMLWSRLLGGGEVQPDGFTHREIVVGPAGEGPATVVATLPDQPRSEKASRFDLGEVPFASELLIAPFQDRVVLLQTGALSIDVMGTAGRVVDSFGLELDPRRIDAALVARDQARREEWYRSTPPTPLQADRLAGVDRLRYPPSFPTASRLLIDPDGAIWVAKYLQPDWNEAEPWHLPPRTVSNEWYVFAADGRPVFEVEFPIGFVMLGVSGGNILGLEFDEFDQEQVAMYRLPPRA